jgi:hypothetical protein
MRAYEDITEEEVDRYFDHRIAGLEMRGETVLPSWKSCFVARMASLMVTIWSI